MIRRVCRLAAVLTTMNAVLVSAAPQDPAVGTLTILSPSDDAYVSGRTLLRARVEPAGAARSVTFFADGRQVCTLARPPFECEWDAGAAVIEHHVRAVATLAGGGRAIQNVRTKGVGYAETVDVDVVQVTATVTDGHGHYVRGLPRAAFHVYEDGRAQTISHFEAVDVPLDLLVALDISGSMVPSVSKLKDAAKKFLAAVPPKDRVTVLSFNDAIFTLTRAATDPIERVKAVDSLAPWGGTALYDVIIRGVDLLGRQGGRKALLVFTDGEDQGSRAPIDEVERRLQASDVTLYMIAQGRGVSMEPLKKIMIRLARPTGGRALFTEKIDELSGAFTELLDELSNQYLLGYSPTNAKRDDTIRQIKLDVEGHHSVRARQSYRAAPPSAK